MITFDDLRAGITPSAALEAFRAGCNQGPDRLFITDSWFAQREQRLRTALPNPITHEVADALRESVLQTRHIDTVIDWLENGAKPWPEYEAWRREENRRLAIEQVSEGYFPWEHVEACRGRRQTRTPKPLEEAEACPQCGTSGQALTWIYFESPRWTWEHLCGRAGWMTVCDDCRLQVQFFLGVLS